MILYINDVPAEEDMEVKTNNGEPGILKSWRAPHKPSSTGRVYVDLENSKFQREFFPSVINGKWK